jgi:chromosome segregation ATPase
MAAPDPVSIPDAMRVAAAAVVAQQALLDEQEARLREREAELARQEQQVGERLAEKGRQVEELQRQLAAAREQFRQDRAEIDEAREEADAARNEAVADRDRLRELRPKFIRRLKRQWAGERKDYERRSAEIVLRRRALDDDTARVATEQQKLTQSESEFRRKADQEREQLRAEAQVLAEVHARFAEERRAAAAELERREVHLAEQTQAVEHARRRGETSRAELEKRCDDLRAEARGLEQRVGNARRLLADASTPATTSPAEAVAFDPTPIAALLAEVPEADRARLREYYERCQNLVLAQAARLADQRVHLTELYQRLTEAEASWEARRAEAVEEMERLCGEFQDREEALRMRSREVEAVAERSRQERERLARLRTAAERQAAELAARKSDWQGEHDRLQTDLDERLRVLAEREGALGTLFRRWRERRRAEVEQLGRLTRESSEARAAWLREREEFQARSESLRVGQQALAEQALALEEARREFLKDVDRPDLAAKRVERLYRRWESLSAATQRELRAYRDRLADEDAELRQIYLELERQQEELSRRDRDLAQRLTELEDERRRIVADGRELETVRRTWETQREQYEEQLASMRRELNRLTHPDDEAPAMLAAA